ncbi:hypothetical protein [Bradyrhizobium retamae]|uniref:hypothetical protein n=1 Tax=Bradyrhizobium retamae TaxID=1300035 RepID=UPI0012E338E1|nr:hypothetical protein [Bradyrhizobium retamae]
MRRAPFAAAEVQQVATDAAEQLGMVAILVNNAQSFTDTPLLEWRSAVGCGIGYNLKARSCSCSACAGNDTAKAWAVLDIGAKNQPDRIRIYDPTASFLVRT